LEGNEECTDFLYHILPLFGSIQYINQSCKKHPFAIKHFGSFFDAARRGREKNGGKRLAGTGRYCKTPFLIGYKQGARGMLGFPLRVAFPVQFWHV
jgi:hypothetical protein